MTSVHKLSIAEYGWPLAVAVLLRLMLFPLAHLSSPELWEYGAIAKNMLAGHGYATSWYYLRDQVLTYPTAFMPPGQAIVLYWPMKLFGLTTPAYWVMYLEEVVMSTLSVLAIGKILGHMFEKRGIAKLGLWLAAIYPSFIIGVTSFGVISAVLMLDAMFLWALLAFTSAMRNREPAMLPAIATGASAAVLTFFRAESIAITFVTLAVLGWLNRSFISRYRKEVATMLAILLVIILPWNIRNYRVFHKVIVGSTNGGFNLWRGNNPGATGSSWDALGRPVWTTDTMWNMGIEPLNQVDPNVELRYDEWNRQEAISWIKSHPAEAAELALKKAILFWGIDWYSASARTPEYIALYILTFAMFVTGLVKGVRVQLWRHPSARDALSVIGVWCVLYTIVTMIFFSLPRLQIILIGVYFPIVVYGAESVMAWLRQKLASQGSRANTPHEKTSVYANQV